MSFEGFPGRDVRAKLDHPVIDADAHVVECDFAHLDFVRQLAGEEMAKAALAVRDHRGPTVRGFWWGLPILSTLLLVGLLIVSLPQPLRAGTEARARQSGSAARPRLPARFWLYAAFATVYGICETMNGNWSATTAACPTGRAIQRSRSSGSATAPPTTRSTAG